MATNDQNQDDSKQSSGKQGFASMDPERQREIASQGGKSSGGGASAKDMDTDDQQEPSSGQRSSSGGTQGGSSEQHAEAGRQSHKNSQ